MSRIENEVEVVECEARKNKLRCSTANINKGHRTSLAVSRSTPDCAISRTENTRNIKTSYNSFAVVGPKAFCGVVVE